MILGLRKPVDPADWQRKRALCKQRALFQEKGGKLKIVSDVRTSLRVLLRLTLELGLRVIVS